MDFNAKIAELLAQKADKVTQSASLLEQGKIEDSKKINDEIKGINNTIEQYQILSAESAGNAVSAEPKTSPNSKNDKVAPYHSLGEQLQAIYNMRKNGVNDERLARINDAAKGTSEGIGSDGGFLVQEDFAGKILESAATSGEILRRVDSYTCSAASNSARWQSVDETDVSTSVFGGIQMYWSSEAGTANATKPQFKEAKLDLEKMMGFAYATDELLADAAFMSGFFLRGFSLATERLLEAGIVSGDGIGKPLGFLNPANKSLIKIAKETSQTAGTITTENLLKMKSRMPQRSRKNAIWLLHPDLEEELPKLSLNGDNVWMPEGGISGREYQTLFGRPIVFDDNAMAQGEAGDISYVDLSQYILLKKGTIKTDWSIHVEFLTDQSCFRIIFRANGAPKTNNTITIKNSSKARSPFITLAERK